ncbi:MAG: hypothetical protein AAB577_00410 [Patescibacteria group bacterium]
MLQEIKYRLLTIFLTQKAKLALLACFVFLGLFIGSQPVHAFALDWAAVTLDALDFIDNSIMRFLVSLALLAIGSTTLLNISAGLLNWSSQLPIGLNEIENPLIGAGWHFTSGLANLSFILIFIVIALAYVLKLDNLKMKKALPQLIIIALLINFSLLFVKIIADAGWIVQSSFSGVFVKDGVGFATAAASTLTAAAGKIIPVITGILIGYIAVAWVPYLNVAALTAIGALVFATGGGALLGTISQAVTLIVFNFIIGFLFLIFAALFLIRIAVIWILAILSPLAFVAYILPSTRKHFNDWLKTLMEWTFLGVVVYFLLGLGLMLFGVVAPGSGQQTSFTGELGKWEFFDTFYKYIFLIIYMIVVLGVCKKFVPAGAQMIWGYAEMAMSRGVKWGAGQSRKWGMRAQTEIEGGVSGAARRSEEKRKKGEAPTRMEKVANWYTRGRPGGLELAEARAAQGRSRLIEEQRKGLVAKTKDLDEDGVKASLRAEFEKHKENPLRDKAKTAALFKLLADKGALDDKDKSFYEEAWKAAGSEEVKNNPVKKAVLAKKLYWGTDEERKYAESKLTPGDIDKWDRSTKENDTIIKEIVGTLRADLITKLGAQTQESSEKVQKHIDQTLGKDFDKLAKGITDITTLSKEDQRTQLKQLEVIKHLHTSVSPEVQTWKKYGTMEKGEPDSVVDLIDKLRKIIK